MDNGDARELSRSLLEAGLPRRWAHSQGVARQAHTLADVLPEYASDVVMAAWLHDIGYAATLQDTGFHPIDGARHLRRIGFGSTRLWTLVAHHTCAAIEAEERGLADVLTGDFPADGAPPLALSALTYCDMTTGPDGNLLDVGQRINEILTRYGPDDIVHHAISRAGPSLRQQVEEVRALFIVDDPFPTGCRSS
jgi:HD domain